MGDFRNCINVGNVAVGIAQGFQIDGLGVGPDGSGDSLQVVGVHKGGLYSELGQGMGQQIVGAAIDGFLCHDMVPRLGQSLDGVRNGRRAGGHSQRRRTALQGRDARFQHLLGGVGQPAVDIAGILQAKPGGGVGGIPEHIAGGLVDGDRTGAGGRVGLLLARVEL